MDCKYFAVGPKAVNGAECARKEVETLGVWVESGSRAGNPFEIRPGLRTQEQKVSQFTDRSELPIYRQVRTTFGQSEFSTL